MKQLAKIQAVLFVLAAGVAHVVVAGGESEAAGGAGQRSQYLAERGIIVPPDEVHTNSYIAGIDYRYPYPERDFGVYLFNGNRQLSIQGQEDILHIGIQAAKTSFEELPPLNLAFVIDHSGSMGSADKLNWVKDAFDIFITQVRDSDYVSLVVFDDTADVVFPATKMDTTDRRAQFRRAVQSVMPDGSTNIRAGLELGSIEVLKNFNSEYTNRVMFLSDGCDTVGNSSDSILDVAHRRFAFFIGRPDDLDNIESKVARRRLEFPHVTHRRPAQDLLFSPVHRFRRPAEILAPARLYLDKNQAIAHPGNQVELIPAADTNPAAQDTESLLLQIAFGALLPPYAGAQVRRALHPAPHPC